VNKNFFKLAFRTLFKYRLNTVINIVGLAIGFSSSVLIINYVYHELKYDDFHEKGDRIYRMVGEGFLTDGKIVTFAASAGEIPQVVLDNVPEVEECTRIYGVTEEEIRIDKRRFNSEIIAWVDTSFFSIFSFPLLRGDPETLLYEPFSVVLSEETAQKYFADTAMNQILTLNGREYKVTGIMENMPANSHIQLDILASFSSIVRPDYNVVYDDGISFGQYYLIQPDVNMSEAEKKIINVAEKAVMERFGPYGITIHHSLQPLDKIHLHSRFNFDIAEQGDVRNIYIFTALAFFIILIAVMNFINLVTAQSDSRTREIGIKKVNGAVRGDLIRQFIGESVLLALIAFLLSLALNEILLPSLSNMLNLEMTLIYWKNPLFFVLFLLFVLLVGVISGIYPAFYLSSFQPVVVLKGGQHGVRKPHALRKILVTLQLTISVFLIISLLILQIQTRFMKNMDPGFDKENVVVFYNLTGKIRDTYQSLKAELLTNPGITSVAASQSIPGHTRSVQNFYKYGDDSNTGMIIHENRVQHDYIKTLGIEMVLGRDFDPEMQTDTAAFIINEAAFEKLGMSDPLGEKIVVWEIPGTIIGVMGDFNFLSLHNEIDPLVLSMYSGYFSYILMRMNPANIKETIGDAETVLSQADPSYNPDHFFLDQDFAKYYQKEEQINRLITTAAILALVLSVLGLYGLTAFTIRKKVKEIGIRKALGSSVSEILVLLSRDLLRWVIIANIIAWPVAYLLINSWLQNFAFSIRILQYWWVFVIAGILALCIGFMTMLYQALSAALSNPVDALRYE